MMIFLNKYNIIFSYLLFSAFFVDLSAQEQKLSIAEIFQKVSNSVVKVYAIDFFGLGASQGSGVVIDDGIIVTNYHVFNGRERIEIEHFGKRYSNTKVLFADPENDILGLKIYDCDLPPIEISESENDLYIGAKVYAIGSPKEFENTITDGIISGIRGSQKEDGYWIQVTAGITHGSSGGAVVNEYGKLIGISTLGVEATNINLNFAVPIYLLKGFNGWCAIDDNICLEKLEKFCLAYNLTTAAIDLLKIYPTHPFEDRVSSALKRIEESLIIDPNQERNKRLIFEIPKHFSLTPSQLKKIKNLSDYFGDGFSFFIEGLELAYLKKNFFGSYDKFIQAISKEPDNAHYFYFLSLAYSSGGHTELAYKNMMKAIQLGDREAESWFEKRIYPFQ